KAEEDFTRAIELNPAYSENFYARAKLYARQGNQEKAQTDLASAVKLCAGNAGAWNDLAWDLVSDPKALLHNPGLGVELAEKAVAAAPGNGSIWNTLGAARYRRGQWKDAIAALEKSMQLRHGGDSEDWFFLAMAHWQLDEKDAARQFYDRAAAW